VRTLSRVRKFELLSILLFIIIAPVVFNGSYALHLINIIGIYAITIIGLDLLVGLTGLISLGHAVFFAGAGYLTAYLNITMSLSPFVACVITILLISIFALITGAPLFRLKGYFLALGTLGFGVVIYTLIKGISIIGGPNGLGGIPDFSIGSFEFKGDLSYFYLIWITVLLVFLFVNNISNSRIGRALKAIHSDEDTAMAFGIRVLSYKMTVYVISAAIAAISGVYYGHYIQFVSPPLSSLATSVDLVVMLFLGGVGTIFGPILGTFIYELIPEVSSALHDYEVLFRGVLLLLVLLFFPKGLYPGIQILFKRFACFLSSKKSSDIEKLKNEGEIKKLG
jgi:branched-chain amino acid transport system permease protein